MEKYGGNQWAVCAGKCENGENFISTALRELKEELGIIVSAQDLKVNETFYHYPEHDPSYHIEWATFNLNFKSKPRIVLNEEHSAFEWAHKDQVLTYDLIDGEAYCISHFLKHSS